MGGICTCCDQEKFSEVNIVVMPTSFETNNENIVLSYLNSDSDSEPLPILSLPPLSEPSSFRSQETPKNNLRLKPVFKSNLTRNKANQIKYLNDYFK